MERLYTYGLEPVLRNVTLAELIGNRCKRRFTQVTADNFDEAAAAVEAGIGNAGRAGIQGINTRG